jgi:spectinomycin phosphotransferase
MREKPAIAENDIRACLQDFYDISVAALNFLSLGLDTYAGVYRVTARDGASYFLKAKRRAFYEPSCLVPRYLSDQGITGVVAPLPTTENKLWTRIGEWTVCLYPFIDGHTDWNMTDKNWRDLGTAFKRIHSVALPPEGFPLLKRETFDLTEYIRWISTFEAQSTHAEGMDAPKYALLSGWKTHQAQIHKIVHLMRELASLLQKQTEPEVICHADLHPANILRDASSNIFVIDWDDVMLAFKERDFIFVPDLKAAQDMSPFFEGYGETEINLNALTYYRCERVITDIIECAKEVFFRDDLEEETRIEAVQLFERVLSEDN